MTILPIVALVMSLIADHRPRCVLFVERVHQVLVVVLVNSFMSCEGVVGGVVGVGSVIEVDIALIVMGIEMGIGVVWAGEGVKPSGVLVLGDMWVGWIVERWVGDPRATGDVGVNSVDGAAVEIDCVSFICEEDGVPDLISC